LIRTAYIDFEFNKIVEANVNLVCCCVYENKNKHKFWLHNSPKEQARLYKFISQFDIIVGYSCVAEARSFLSLNLDPLSFKWVDLFLEYRMITNHNDNLQWGKQLVDGKVKHFSKPKPKWQRSEEDLVAGFKATHSLAEAAYKLTGVIRDTKEKKRMRDLIISAPKKFTDTEKNDIMNYCIEDVIDLPNMWRRIRQEIVKLQPDVEINEYIDEAIYRGRYSAHTAIMESTGYPIDIEATRNFSKQIPNILMDCQRDINHQFKDIKPFKWAAKTCKFTWDQKATRKWIAENHDVKKWLDTDSGNTSLSLDAFSKYYNFKHDYPTGNFGAQMVRFLKLKQSLYGFSDTGGNRKNFWDSVGSDGRVRPYMNIYGAQSSRSQPSASGFMFLKPAWMRSLVVPEPNKFIASIDYGQQEFFVAALESGDKNMIDAYLSGDPYLHTAKLCGAVPKDGKREDYKALRELFKNTTLGISYLMTKYGLAIKLSQDTGREWSEEEAQVQIDMFYEAYPALQEWQEENVQLYQEGGGIKLPCGWRMYSDNDNFRSVTNVPIQGFGASVMRKAVDLAVGRGCSVIFTLHDALYIEGTVGCETDIAILYDSMVEAFQFYYKYTKKYEIAGKIKLDPYAWSPSYEKDSQFEVGTKLVRRLIVPCSNKYIDERALDEYNRFSKYFKASDADLL
jgi:hypothetical protein